MMTWRNDDDDLDSDAAPDGKRIQPTGCAEPSAAPANSATGSAGGHRAHAGRFGRLRPDRGAVHIKQTRAQRTVK